MARKRDEQAAAKAKKQKTILIVGGVLLLAVAAIQVPKLLKKDAPPETAAATTTGAPLVAIGTTSGGATVAVASSKSGAVVAGVALPRSTDVSVAPGQLASFTLFEVKDPFVQQGPDAASGAGAAAATDPFFTDGPATTDAGSGSAAPSDAGAAAPAPPPPPVVYATINFQGDPQQVKVKDTFPADEPLFVLRSVTKKQAKIGVAGGTFDDGQAVVLKLGKKVTLVNTATGVRYVLKLVYTGATPEVIEGFTTGAAQPATTEPAAGDSTTTTTAK